MSLSDSTRFLVSIGMIGLLLLTVQSASAQNEPFDREAVKRKDSVVLKSGAKLFGVLKSQGKDEEGRRFIIFEAENGGLLKLDVARMVKDGKVHRIDELDQEYNQFVSDLDDTPEAHWELCSWLREQSGGKFRFRDQIRFHLERIMELDPNDVKAKRALGYRLIKERGGWVPEQQYYQSRGYEKANSGWVPTLQRNLSARFERENSIEGDRKQAFAMWKKKLRKSNVSAATVRQELFGICDAYSVVLIFEDAREESNPTLRALYVEAFGRVPTSVAMKALCYFAVEEPAVDIRDRALTLLAQDYYNQASAAAVLEGYLRHPNRVFVINAAFAIGELGSERSIIPLVGALVTKHQIAPGDQPGRMQTGFGNNGNVESFRMGGDSKPKILAFKNREVVNALRKITGQDYGFDAAEWKRWYIENLTHYDLQVRR